MTAGYQVSDTNPIPVFPGGKQGEVAIYNSGTNTVWVSSDNSPINGIPITAGNSIAWNALTPLYAYILDRALSTSVLIIDSGVTLPSTNVTANIPGTVAVDASAHPLQVSSITSPVTANIPGTVAVDASAHPLQVSSITSPVTANISGTVAVDASAHPLQVSSITSPVLIQGGGTYLGLMTFVLAAHGTVTLNVPSVSLQYQSLRFVFSSTSTSGFIYWLLNVGYPPNLDGTVVWTTTSYSSFIPNFLVPNTGAPPYTLNLTELTGIAQTVTVRVWGEALPLSTPTTDMASWFNKVQVTIPTGSTYIVLPATFESYYATVTTDSLATIPEIDLYEVQSDGTQQLADSLITLAGSVSGTVQPNTRFSFPIRGSGRAQQLNFTGVNSPNSGGCRISFSPAPAPPPFSNRALAHLEFTGPVNFPVGNASLWSFGTLTLDTANSYGAGAVASSANIILNTRGIWLIETYASFTTLLSGRMFSGLEQGSTFITRAVMAGDTDASTGTSVLNTAPTTYSPYCYQASGATAYINGRVKTTLLYRY